MKRVILGLFAILSLLTGCNQDGDSVDIATLQFQFNYNVNGAAFELQKTYQINGTAVSFVNASWYLGGLVFTQENANKIDFTGQYLLVGPGSGANVNEPILESKISRVQFFVGVDPVTNKMNEIDFTSRPVGDPLGMQEPSMHWGWNSGYRFIRLDLQVDTDGNGTTDSFIEYHLGTDAMLKNVDLTANIPIVKGLNKLTIDFDLAKVFKDIDLKTEEGTHTSNNIPLAEKIRDNLPGAFAVQPG